MVVLIVERPSRRWAMTECSFARRMLPHQIHGQTASAETPRSSPPVRYAASIHTLKHPGARPWSSEQIAGKL